VIVILFVRRTQRGAKDWSATRSVQGKTSIKRYLCHPSFSCVSLDIFERKSVSTLSIFCLRVRVKLFEAIYLSAGRFSYNKHPIFSIFFHPYRFSYEWVFLPPKSSLGEKFLCISVKNQGKL
jgi:hypothetical protein